MLKILTTTRRRILYTSARRYKRSLWQKDVVQCGWCECGFGCGWNGRCGRCGWCRTMWTVRPGGTQSVCDRERRTDVIWCGQQAPYHTIPLVPCGQHGRQAYICFWGQNMGVGRREKRRRHMSKLHKAFNVDSTSSWSSITITITTSLTLTMTIIIIKMRRGQECAYSSPISRVNSAQQPPLSWPWP